MHISKIETQLFLKLVSFKDVVRLPVFLGAESDNT